MPSDAPSRKVSVRGSGEGAARSSAIERKTARSTAPPPTVPSAEPSAKSASFCPGVHGAEPCRAITVATTTRSPRSSRASTDRRTSVDPAVRGISAEVSITAVEECTEASMSREGTACLSGKSGPMRSTKYARAAHAHAMHSRELRWRSRERDVENDGAKRP